MLFFVVFHWHSPIWSSKHRQSLLVTFSWGILFKDGGAIIWDFLCLSIPTPATLFLLPLVGEFLSFSVSLLWQPTRPPPGNLSLEFQKMALGLQSAGTLAQSGGWFSKPAPCLPELPWALQGEGPTRNPWRAGGGVCPALGALKVPMDAGGRFPAVVLKEACGWVPCWDQSLSRLLKCWSACLPISFLSLLMEVPSQHCGGCYRDKRCRQRCPAELG